MSKPTAKYLLHFKLLLFNYIYIDNQGWGQIHFIKYKYHYKYLLHFYTNTNTKYKYQHIKY